MENKQLKSFKDLIVWQKSVDLAVLTYSVTEKFPKSELYGITNQMRRSAVSISSNIAEGFKRSHQKEKLQFYNVAYASTSELESQIEVSRKLDFLDSQNYQKLCASVVEVGKMIDGLVKSTNREFPKYHILNPVFFFVFLTSIFYILNPSPAFSAGLLFEAKDKEFMQGDEFVASVFLTTEGESINAVEGKISFPSKLLEIKEVRDGNSVVNFWVERPKLGQFTDISFSGIIPGGYQRPKGFLFSVVFRAKENGKGTLEIRDARALRNDSEGTPAVLKISPFKLSIVSSSQLSNRTATLEVDTLPPEGFKPEIARDEALFGGQWFIVFATQDKVSGIDHYEVCEETKTSCVIAESPHLLKNQKLDKKIFIKAFDRNGNEKVEVAYPPNWNPWYKNNRILAILILSMFIVLIITRKFYGKNS